MEQVYKKESFLWNIPKIIFFSLFFIFCLYGANVYATTTIDVDEYSFYFDDTFSAYDCEYILVYLDLLDTTGLSSSYHYGFLGLFVSEKPISISYDEDGTVNFSSEDTTILYKVIFGNLDTGSILSGKTYSAADMTYKSDDFSYSYNAETKFYSSYDSSKYTLNSHTEYFGANYDYDIEYYHSTPYFITTAETLATANFDVLQISPRGEKYF